jgi:hypothetical protein
MTAAHPGRRTARFLRVLALPLFLGDAFAAPTWDVVNVHPSGSIGSRLTATTGTRQVGASAGHAGLWNGTATSFVDIQPAGVDTTYPYGMNASQQVGYSVAAGNLHAFLANGTAASFVDLHPAGTVSSYAYATDGTTQAGYFNTATESHACIWNGTAASVQDLNPIGIAASQIMAGGGGQQGGRIVVGGLMHAAIWQGTAVSYVDLNPVGASQSLVSATDGSTQGGYGIFGGITHAGIWRGTIASFVDLHPAGSTTSFVNAVSGAYQAGSVYFAGIPHAALWNGTVASFIDLHAVLPAGYSESAAQGVWTDGQIIQVVGSAYNSAAMREEAVIWNGDLFPHRPVVTLIGKKHQTTAKAALLIRGRARDLDNNLSKVEVKVGKQPYRKAKGTPARWKFTVRLKPGVNKVTVRAEDTAGAVSRPLNLVLKRL